MAKKVELKERGTNEVIYPVTRKECILDFEEVPVDIPVASDTVNGLMSSTDKVKLDSLKNVYTILYIDDEHVDYDGLVLAINNDTSIKLSYGSEGYSEVVTAYVELENIILCIIYPGEEILCRFTIHKDGTYLVSSANNTYNIIYLNSIDNSVINTTTAQYWLIRDTSITNNYYISISNNVYYAPTGTIRHVLRYIDTYKNEIVCLEIHLYNDLRIDSCKEISRTPLGGTTEIATQTKDGLLSKEDKTKLDSVRTDLLDKILGNPFIVGIDSRKELTNTNGSYLVDYYYLTPEGEYFDDGGFYIYPATTTTNGVMTFSDKKKLDGFIGLRSVHNVNYTSSKVTLSYMSLDWVDGQWKQTNGTMEIPAATSTNAGVMTAEDKVKLDNLNLMTNVTVLTESEYNSLTEKDPDTIYFIK